LKASALLSDSTIKDRNKKIGGHNAWVLIVGWLSGRLLLL
jgi:hypothetical protein